MNVKAMTKAQAIKMARQLSAQGMHYPKIVQALFDAGFVGRTGKGINPNTLTSWVGKRKRRAPAAMAAAKLAPKPKRTAGMLKLVRLTLQTNDMPAEDRIALALLMIGDGD